MIVYWDRREPRRCAPVLRRLTSAADTLNPPAAEDALLAVGELECGLLDGGADTRIEALCDRAMLSLARLASGRAADAVALRELAAADLPAEVAVSIPEGFAYYGLFPAMYRQAAADFHLAHKPAAAAVVGIRSIGCVLSAVVAAELADRGCAIARFTVRPEGHPFDRRLRFTPDQARRVRNGWLVICDEGPGISGSSFASVIQAGLDCGVPLQRMVLFPSWNPDPRQLQSASARDLWPRVEKYTHPFSRDLCAPHIPAGAADLSAGRWRQGCGGRVPPPVQPQHERIKFLDSRSARVWKFTGLGEYGRASAALADLLSPEFVPRSFSHRSGFLESEWLQGSPLDAGDAGKDFLRFAAGYLRHRASLPASGPGVGFDQIAAMIEHNCSACGLSVPDLAKYRTAFDDGTPAAIDGRMNPHEWLAGSFGFRKTDALDHHRDHFLPGCQDILWDVAGLEAEFDLPPSATAFVLRAMGREKAQPRLPFYRAAYCSLRLGYASLAAGTLALSDPVEASAFARLAGGYKARVQAALRALP